MTPGLKTTMRTQESENTQTAFITWELDKTSGSLPIILCFVWLRIHLRFIIFFQHFAKRKRISHFIASEYEKHPEVE